MLPCNPTQDHCQKWRIGTNNSRTQSFSSCYSSGGESFEILGYSPCSENLSDWVTSDKIDFAELSSGKQPRAAPTLADTSAWLTKESCMNEEPAACSAPSLFPAYFFNSGLDFWLQTPVSYSVNDDTDLPEKLASLAVRFDGDDGKELDQSEVVALVCCQQGGIRCDGFTSTEANAACKNFVECRSKQCASRLVAAATNSCSPDVAAWLSHQTGLLPTETLQELNGQQEDTVPAYLQQLRKICCSDLSLWMTETRPEATTPEKVKETATSEASQWLVESEDSSDSDLFAGWKRRWQSTRDEDAKKENIWLASAKDLEITETELDEFEFLQSHPSARKITKIANLLLNDEISTEAMMEMIPPYPYHQTALQPYRHFSPPPLAKPGKAEQVAREDAVF